jgi:hypothetical protein
MLEYARLDATSVLNIRPPLDSIAHLRLEKRQEGSFSSVGFKVSTLDYILSLPGLQSLSISGSFFEIHVEDFQRRTEPIEAQSLKHFRCGNSLYGPVHLYFLAHVSAPALETIAFHKLHFSHDSFDIPEARLTYSYPSLQLLALLDLDGPHINFQGHDPTVISQVMTLTRNIKALIFAHIALSHEPSHLLLEMIIVGGQSNSWANLQHMIIFDPGLPRTTCLRLVNEWPKPRNIHLSQAFITNVMLQWPHTSPVTLRTIEGLHQLSPPYWPPGFDWMDNEEDPFHLDIGTVMVSRGLQSLPLSLGLTVSNFSSQAESETIRLPNVVRTACSCGETNSTNMWSNVLLTEHAFSKQLQPVSRFAWKVMIYYLISLIPGR